MARGRPAKKRTRSRVKEEVPDVYRELLADAVSSSPSQMSADGRAIKRRRVGGRIVAQSDEETAVEKSNHSNKTADDSDLDDLFEDVRPSQQKIIQTESDDSADSDIDWEEVEPRDRVSQQGTPEPEEVESGGFSLVLRDGDEHKAASSVKSKRKPMTTEDKKLRLDIHKMHVCCLMAHVFIRNHWCNDEKVYSAVRKLLTKKMISYLNPDEDTSQFQRSRSFMDGLTHASESFRGKFKVIARGMGKSRWADGPETLALLQPPDDIDLPMQMTDFRDAAHQLEGSRDIGAQLFCAMLRSAGADARLVCSLQSLPFQPSPKVELHQVEYNANKTAERKDREDILKDQPGAEGVSDASANAATSAVLMERSASPPMELLSSRIKRKPPRESKYPVYWVEAFNEAVQKWMPVDPLVTKTIAKPSKFEPPAGEPQNGMTYVIGFEDDGSARDVTKRYVKAYNGKTRRERVEVTDEGERWWRRAMKMYKRSHRMDRDQLEDAELATKEAAEPMPRNVQDFKDHPYYALERHLRRHEVIHPKREVGKVGAGRPGSTSNLEPIFRRRDVQMVKSADKWYRLGREIKPEEQPLKRVAARRTRQQSLDPEQVDPADIDHAGTALYAAYQTKLYSAPPVVNGLIPKNAYGNLDIYVTSMVPSGGAHINHPETAKAAKIIGIDYADAITGFSFKGRHGTAITKGAVVASEYREAIEEVIRTFENDRARAEEERRSLEALRMWKRLLAGLRIRERIEGYDIEGERDVAMKEELEKVEQKDEDGVGDDDGGGFLPDRENDFDAQPTVGRKLEPRSLASLAEDEGGGFMAEDTEDQNVQSNSMPPRPRDSFLNNIDDDDGSGFLVNDDDADAEEALRDTRFNPDPAMNPTEHATDRESEILTDPEDFDKDEPEGSGAGGAIYPEDAVSKTADDLADQVANEMANETTIEMAKERSNDTLNGKFKDKAPDLTSSDLLPEDLEEARMLQQLHESDTMAQDPVSLSHPSSPATSNQSQQPDIERHQIDQNSGVDACIIEDPSPSSPRNDLVDEDANEGESSESDKGSLISRDPEDEDAEPEWLV